MGTKLIHWAILRARRCQTTTPNKNCHQVLSWETTSPRVLLTLNKKRSSGSKPQGIRKREDLLMPYLTNILIKKRARNNSSSHYSKAMIHSTIYSSNLDWPTSTSVWVMKKKTKMLKIRRAPAQSKPSNQKLKAVNLVPQKIYLLMKKLKHRGKWTK